MNAITTPTLARAVQAYQLSAPQVSAVTHRSYLAYIRIVCRELGPGRRLDQVTTDEIREVLARQWEYCVPITQSHARSAVRAWLRWCHEQGWATPTVPGKCPRTIMVLRKYPRALDGDTLGEVNQLRAQGLSEAEIAQRVVIPTGPLAGKHPSRSTVKRALTWCDLFPDQAARALEGIKGVVLAYGPHLHRYGQQHADQHGYYRPHRDTLALLNKLRRPGMPVAVTITGPGRPQPTPPKQARVPRALRDAGALVLTEDELGQTKPSRGYYQAVAQACQLPPEQLLHVGPQLFADVLEPIAAGMRAALVVPNRHGPDDLPDGVLVLGHPRELPHLVSQARIHLQRVSAAGAGPR